MADLPQRVEIAEEGPREGFQIEPGPIPTADKVALIDALAATGLHHIQICSFVNPRLVPGWADAEAVAGLAMAKVLQRTVGVDLNTARAGLHDTAALTASLADGHLGGAGLDHFEGERLDVDDPLCAMSNVVLTPHIGGATYDTETNHTSLIVDGLVSLLDGGSPPNLVNPEVLK